MLPTETTDDPKEFKIPIALLAVGILIDILHAAFFSGAAGAAATFLAMGIVLVIQVTLGLVACLLAGKIVGADYGALFPGCCKLAAIFVFPGAIALCIPIAIISWVVQLLLYWGLIEWLFGLDPVETIVTVIVIWVVNAGAFFVVAATLASMHH